eukprot:snap_masked-scaffold_49-processed-gene-1.29-mRNA-1 protein AED:1.00 eAED:1.00 QI:0/0/0/0/1/1/5/0/151
MVYIINKIIIRSSKDKKESEKFNKALKTFLQSMKVNKEITSLRFNDCPLFVLNEEFERLLNRFFDCSINSDIFNILSKPKIFPMLNKIDFICCEIISFESFDMFISKRTKVEMWLFRNNNFTVTELSSIFQTLSENNTMKYLRQTNLLVKL